MPILYYLTKHIIYQDTEIDHEEGEHNWEFILAASLVHLRLLNIRKMIEAHMNIFFILQDVFYLHRLALENLLSWTLADIKLILCVHYFSCGWIFINRIKLHYGWVNFVAFSDDESYLKRYIESVYFMCTTISTVGYGDFSAIGLSDGSKDYS